MGAAQPIELRIPARDGFQLGATIFEAPDPRGTIVLSGATGVPHRFYRRFAAYLAGEGYTTVTYDYRGIGASAPPHLRGFEATMTDWALQDLAGAVDWAAAELPGRLLLIGHSVGGQVAGLLDVPERIAGMVTVSSQSGYWGLQGGEQKLVVAAHVYVTLPLTARMFGYAPWSRFAAGEDLPKGVALQWSAWCRDRRYLGSDSSLPLERFGAFTAPVLAYSFSDDKWGRPKSVDTMMAVYPHVERRHISVERVGLSRIGHLGFFRAESHVLWPDLLEWLDAR